MSESVSSNDDIKVKSLGSKSDQNCETNCFKELPPEHDFSEPIPETGPEESSSTGFNQSSTTEVTNELPITNYHRDSSYRNREENQDELIKTKESKNELTEPALNFHLAQSELFEASQKCSEKVKSGASMSLTPFVSDVLPITDFNGNDSCLNETKIQDRPKESENESYKPTLIFHSNENELFEMSQSPPVSIHSDAGLSLTALVSGDLPITSCNKSKSCQDKTKIQAEAIETKESEIDSNEPASIFNLNPSKLFETSEKVPENSSPCAILSPAAIASEALLIKECIGRKTYQDEGKIEGKLMKNENRSYKPSSTFYLNESELCETSEKLPENVSLGAALSSSTLVSDALPITDCNRSQSCQDEIKIQAEPIETKESENESNEASSTFHFNEMELCETSQRLPDKVSSVSGLGINCCDGQQSSSEKCDNDFAPSRCQCFKPLSLCQTCSVQNRLKS